MTEPRTPSRCQFGGCGQPGNSWSVWPNGARGWHCDEHAAALAMSLAEVRQAAADGGIEFGLSIRVTAAEMRDWDSNRISRFFAGIAMVQSAAKDSPR